MNAYGFMPHGFCFEWRPGVLWLHVLSDAGIAIAYYGISFVLFYFTRKRRELPFQLLFWLFAAFITLCGTTHLASIWVLWHANYYAEGWLKAVTAVVSIGTLVVLTYILPKVLHVAQSMEALIADRSAQLAEANDQLRSQIAARETIESALRQSQKMQALGQLTGGIAHDFNNMLLAIGGSLEMMQGRIEQGRVNDVLQHVESSRKTVDRATGLTNRLLAFARRQPLQPMPVHLDQLIAGLEGLIRSTVSTVHASITVTFDLNDGGWPVRCDPNQLESALLNVTINARDAMTKDGALVISTRQLVLGPDDVTGHEGATPGDYVEITIADTGSGMDEATRTRVFEPFFTTKPTGQGTGLGLSQVYGFVMQSGGLIWLDSAPGLGTTVRFALRRTTENRTDVQTVPDAARPRRAAKAILLLVEDEPIVRSVTAEYLRELGYHVLEAEDGAAALAVVAQAPVLDILITDVGLPGGINGRQLADAALAMRPNLPVLFITGYAGSAKLDDLGPDMHIMGKPFKLAAFAVRVETMLERTQETPAL